MYIDDEMIVFSYGASESTAANLLTELIIGCSDLKILKHRNYKLDPAGATYRKTAELLADIE